jgi:prepilin peptidase CpaA
MVSGNYILIACVVAFTAVAAVLDFRTKRLPNWLTVTAFFAALLFHIIYGWSQGGFGMAGQHFLFAMGGFATGFGILFILWVVGSGGGGDVKFMGALGAWLGAMMTLYVFVVSALLIVLGSAAVLTYQFCQKGFNRTRTQYIESGRADGKRHAPAGDVSEQRRRTKRRLMPFGVPAALATWLVLLLSALN